jgi:hypothetical protein
MKRLFYLVCALAAGILAIYSTSNNAVQFSNTLKGTDISAAPTSGAQPVYMARITGQCDCF